MWLHEACGNAQAGICVPVSVMGSIKCGLHSLLLEKAKYVGGQSFLKHTCVWCISAVLMLVGPVALNLRKISGWIRALCY